MHCPVDEQLPRLDIVFREANDTGLRFLKMAIRQEVLEVLRGIAEQGLLNGDRLGIMADVDGDEAVTA